VDEAQQAGAKPTTAESFCTDRRDARLAEIEMQFTVTQSCVVLYCARMVVQRSQKIHVAVGAVRLIRDWRGGSPTNESTLHQLSPYIGKVKSAMAGSLI
jgi:hypothetical protein